MYEQVSRDCFIRFICCLAVSLKFNSLAIFVVAVDGVGFNFNRYFSSSVYVVIDTKLFDPILPMCDKSSCLYQRISVPIVNYIYYGNYFFSICWIKSCGCGIILWIVNTILFQAERPWWLLWLMLMRVSIFKERRKCVSESLERIDGFSQGYFKPPFVVHWCCSPSRNCGVLSTFNYQHSVILPRLGNFDFGQLLDTELSCG